MSSAVIHGDTVYLQGLTGEDATADIKGQTQSVLDKIDARLADAGSDKSKILSATIWMSDISAFNEMNGVWDAWVDTDNPPARACVESKLALPAFKVEIGIIAAK